MSENKTTAPKATNQNTDSKIGTIVLILFLLVGLALIASQFFGKANTTATTPKATSALTVEKGEDVAELKIEDTQVGTGREVKSGDQISIHYKGTLLNGKEFDSSYVRNKPIEVQIGTGAVIKGWDEGIIGLKEGGKRKLTIPSSKAYGAVSKPTIPANSALIFEVELIKIADKVVDIPK